MEIQDNVSKAKDITKCLWFPQNCTEGDIQNMLMEMAKWKDEQILSDDDDKLATEVKVDGVTITPPQGYLIGMVTHINDSLIVELKKK